MEPQFSCDLGLSDRWNSFDCSWWRTWHQQLGQPYLNNLDIISTYTFFLLFCCFDRVLMSSVLSLAQPFIISVFIMQGFWLIMMNLSAVMNLVEIQFCCRCKDKWRWLDSFCLSRWAWGTSQWNLQCSQSCSSCPFGTPVPQKHHQISFYFVFLSRFRIVWCVRVSIKQ